ncbi:hypothetical protein ABFT23_17410 [Nocardioides sp. C4-1]|uniref:hypothetical protein n=1 Tax=Nocardioides sp. C4-1 TaxID=3151851 RepID=UPI003267A987
MTWRWRAVAPALLLAAGSVLAGCSDGQPTVANATSPVIPGSTVTIGSEPAAVRTAEAEPSESPGSSEPSEPSTPETSSSPPVAVTLTTARQLLERVADGMVTSAGGAYTVHVSIGDGEVPAAEADHVYFPAEASDYQAAVGATEIRRTGGTVYARSGPGAPWVSGDGVPDDLAAYAAWDLLTDLRLPLEAAEGFGAVPAVTVDGTAYDTYTFTVEASAVASVPQVPDDATGAVDVTFSIDASGKPVRVDLALADGSLVRTDYTGYGAPVVVEAPAVG